MPNRPAGSQSTLEAQGPYQKGVAVTPADGADVVSGKISGGLWVGGAGTLSVVMADGTTLNIAAVPAGAFLPLQVSRVRSTGTSATSILFLY